MLTRNANLLIVIQPHHGPVQVWMTSPAEIIHDATQHSGCPLFLYERDDYATLQEMSQEYADDEDTPPSWLAETLAHFNHLANEDGTLPIEITGPIAMVEFRLDYHVTLNPSVEQQLDAALGVLNDWQHYQYAYDQATFDALLEVYPQVKGKGWYVDAVETEEDDN